MYRFNGFALAGMGLLITWSSPSKALINGVVTNPEDYPEVMRLVSDKDKCTAVLVGPRVVMTNASCVKQNRQGTLTSPSTEETYQATFTLSPLYPAQEHDLALGILEEPIEGSTPATIRTSAPSTGARVQMLGFGCAEDPGNGVPQFDQKLRMGDSVLARTQHLFSVAAGGAVACYQDNGGPVYVNDGGERALAGIMFFGDFKTSTYLIRMDSDASQDFFKSFAQAHDVEICGINSDCSDDSDSGEHR